MIIVLTGLGAMIWFGVKDVTNGEISAGELASFVFYSIMVARSVAVISEIYGQLQRAAGATERLLELLSEKPQITTPTQPKKLEKGTLSLSFNNVSFSYPSRTKEVALNQLNFRVIKVRLSQLLVFQALEKQQYLNYSRGFMTPLKEALMLVI